MMRTQKKLYVVTDLGPGDGGKGGVVHKISHLRRAHTIVKVGGAQGSHGVRTSSGEHFAFSQFGCGTFEGVRTHLTPRFVFMPEGVLNEGGSLKYEHGLHDVFDLLTVDEAALCAVHYHGIASRIKELGRKNNPRGTIGTGVGEAYRFSERFPELAIRAGELLRTDLRDRIASIRQQVEIDLAPIFSAGFLPEDEETARHELGRLRDPGFLEYVVKRCQEAARMVKIVGIEYFRKEVLGADGVIVCESSHGVLTDHFMGFHPHTSAIRTLPRFARAMVEGAGYDGEIVNIGVHRAYTIRHGAGPMPTADEAMAEALLPGSCKEDNRWQGRVRVGPLDLILLRYAIAASGGPKAYDGLAITWFDQVQRNGSWWFADRYSNPDYNFFTPQGEPKVRVGEDAVQLDYLEALGKALTGMVPVLDECKISEQATREELYELCAGVLYEKLQVPVRMISFGSTERDKICK